MLILINESWSDNIDKVDFKAKNTARDKKSFSNEKDVNLSRGHNNPKLLCT